MDFPANLFPFAAVAAANLISLALLAGAVRRVRWRALPASALNAWLGATVLVMVLWTIKADFRPGLSFHLLGSAILTLLAGPRLALVATALIELVTVMLAGDPLAFGLNWLTCGLLPVGLIAGGLWLARRFLPANYFVYLFLNAFLAGGLSMAASGIAGIGLLGVAGAYGWPLLLEDALPYYLLLSWSEAFTTGLVLAIMVVYRPHWVASFDDARYLNDKLDLP